MNDGFKNIDVMLIYLYSILERVILEYFNHLLI